MTYWIYRKNAKKLAAAFLRRQSRNMGWQITTIRTPRKKGSLERAIEDVRAGRVYQADSVEDLMAQLEA